MSINKEIQPGPGDSVSRHCSMFLFLAQLSFFLAPHSLSPCQDYSPGNLSLPVPMNLRPGATTLLRSSPELHLSQGCYPGSQRQLSHGSEASASRPSPWPISSWGDTADSSDSKDQEMVNYPACQPLRTWRLHRRGQTRAVG